MRVHRSHGEVDLTYVLLKESEILDLRKDLRKAKSPLAKLLRAELKKVLRG